MTEGYNIEAGLIQIVRSILKNPKEEVPRHANLGDDLAMDSLERTNLMLDLEEKFSIKIPDEQFDALFGPASTIQTILDYLTRRGL